MIGYGGGPARGAVPRAFRPSRSSSRGFGKGELFGDGWRVRLHAFRPGVAAAEGLHLPPGEPRAEAIEDRLMEVDIFDGASDAASGAFTEGSWGDRSDRDIYQVLEDPLYPINRSQISRDRCCAQVPPSPCVAEE